LHIPDGFLDARTAVVTGVLATAGLGLALRRARVELPPRRVPLLGLAASFVFAAQLVNFPVAGGTSGHLIGAVLASVLLGPSAAVVALSAVLIVQCLIFADGGLSALGANILNMAVLGGVGGWAVYHAVSRVMGGSLLARLTAAAFAGWCSTVLAAVACAGELAASRTVSWNAALPAMAGVHMLIGVGEGLITALVLSAIARTRPELLQPDTATPPRRSYAAVAGYGTLIALALALFASPFASHLPDGLEHVAAVLGFARAATPPLAAAPLPEYALPGLHGSVVATSLAAAIGTVVAFLLAWLLARGLAPRAHATAGSAGAPR
jgi:cobalt/nickel transport system permease protein